MNRMKVLTGVMMLGVCVCLAAISAAADEKKVGDKEFAQKVSAAGLAEVNLSQLALRFARDLEVKRFAQRMVIDHTKAGQQLMQIANARQIRLPEGMDEKHQKLFDKLKTLKGEEFDRTYMEAMVKDHEEAVSLFESEAKDGKDAALKRMATNLEPAMKKHLEMARDICKNVKGEKRGAKGGKEVSDR
jgi:putative membrane protein